MRPGIIIALAIVIGLGGCLCTPAVDKTETESGNKPTLTPKVLSCESAADFGTSLGRIDWSRVPEFRLNSRFTTVWEGPHFDDPNPTPLAYGFSHVAYKGASYDALAKIPPNQRAIMIYNTAQLYFNREIGPQPWRTVKSPWGNDLDGYRSEWDQRLAFYASRYPDTAGRKIPDAQLLCLDTEADLQTDKEILVLRDDPATPEAIRALPDGEFIAKYKKDMAALYVKAAVHFKKSNPRWRVTSYGDAPVSRDFYGIPKHDWTYWTKDPLPVNYLFWDPAVAPGERRLGALYHQLNLIAPSAYQFYDYPDLPNPVYWNQAGAYLGYLLQQVEANKARSDKPIIVFEWMHFHDCCRSKGRPLRAEMAQASAIFPLMAGAEGIWLWELTGKDTPGGSGLPDHDYSAYLQFVRGLARLAEFNDLFDGTPEYVAQTSPPELIRDRLPVWRGVKNKNRLLVAAQNPYARDGAKTDFDISYRGKVLGPFSSTGREVCLALYELE